MVTWPLVHLLLRSGVPWSLVDGSKTRCTSPWIRPLVPVSWFPTLSPLPPFNSLWEVRRRVRALWLQPADSACAQVRRPDGSLPVQRARARRLDSSLFLQRLVLVRLLRSLSLLPFMGSPPWFTRSVEVVGAEEYGLFLDGLPQLSARPLSNRYAWWRPRYGTRLRARLWQQRWHVSW